MEVSIFIHLSPYFRRKELLKFKIIYILPCLFYSHHRWIAAIIKKEHCSLMTVCHVTRILLSDWLVEVT